MSSVVSYTGLDAAFLTNYFFGFVIIVLYAKDKFNTPAYDKESMGSFSQLPPQLLTIDARYRQGMRIYMFLLLALYTALCIIGPNTFSGQNIQLGFTANTNQLWPAASATFLISTGTAKDSSVLGKIEHFIRQYAQKAAYIPSIVSNLAYAIRNAEITPWLKENKYKLKPDEFGNRKTALTALIGEGFVTKINENPRQQGHLAAWARANIVFYCLQQMFRGVLPSERLSQLVELPENVAILERLEKERSELKRKFINAEEQWGQNPEARAEADVDKLLSDVQRFSKEVSLMIVILLSQAARTFSDLKQRLDQLGFQDIELRDNSDHLVYLVMVNCSILLGAFVSYGVLISSQILAEILQKFPYLDRLQEFFTLSQKGPSNDFSMINHVNELLIVGTGALIYMVVFKVIDYLRESSLDRSEWRENLQGYVMIVVNASLCSAVICILSMVLLLSPLGLLGYIWRDLAGLVQQFLFQWIVAGLAAGFTVSYLRQAVQMQWPNVNQNRWPKIILNGFVYFRELPDFLKLIHAVLAACLVGMLTHVSFVHTRNVMINDVKSRFDTVQQSFDQAQGWLGQKVADAEPRRANPDSSSQQKSRAPSRDLDSSSQKTRLPSPVLIGISCKLRAMRAVIHVFDVDNGVYQLSPDLDHDRDAAKDGAAKDGAAKDGAAKDGATKDGAAKDGATKDGATRDYDCEHMSAQGTSIQSQIGELKNICMKLNKIGIAKSQQGASGSGPPREANQPPPQKVIFPTLFQVPERCELNPTVSTENPNEQNFLGFGKSLSDLFETLGDLNKFSSGNRNRADVVLPMIAAFFIAYVFGGGCHVWRAWWLNNETGQKEIEKLREQIVSIYGEPQPDQFEKWLTMPLSFLNNVAPKEAVRYEGLKARLYAKIESGQVDFRNVVAAAEAGTAQ